MTSIPGQFDVSYHVSCCRNGIGTWVALLRVMLRLLPLSVTSISVVGIWNGSNPSVVALYLLVTFALVSDQLPSWLPDRCTSLRASRDLSNRTPSAKFALLATAGSIV